MQFPPLQAGPDALIMRMACSHVLGMQGAKGQARTAKWRPC